MSRHEKIRSVSPRFWRDEEITELSMGARLLLIGLSQIADDQGVFRWKPVEIKGFVFPIDAVDIKALLGELLTHDLVREYEADGSRFGAIKAFCRHQNPRDARAHFPLPAHLDRYVRIEERVAPRARGDRPAPIWPRRPVDVPGPSQGQTRDVPGSSQVERRGEEGRGGETMSGDMGAGDQASPECSATSPSFEPPPWVPRDWLVKRMADAEEQASTIAGWDKIPMAYRQRAIKLGCIQLLGEPSKGWESNRSRWESELSYKTDVGVKTAQWIRERLKKRDRARGSVGTYFRAVCQHGPDSSGWLPPGTPAPKEAVA